LKRIPCRRHARCTQGFTLIEVIAALVIFSLGVLMVIRLTTALGRQMQYSGKSSELVVRAEERLDSLESLDFDSLAAGTASDTLTVQGTPYARTVVISAVTGVLFKIDVTLAPVTAGSGPSYSTTSYRANSW
jgi:prepilin-type N-terminal cleavage/methylation domain-containing protein